METNQEEVEIILNQGIEKSEIHINSKYLSQARQLFECNT